MFFGINAQLLEALQIEVLNVMRRGLQDDLILVIVLHAVWIFAVAAIGGTAAGLRIGGSPWLGPERTQERRRVKGPGAHFKIIGLV